MGLATNLANHARGIFAVNRQNLRIYVLLLPIHVGPFRPDHAAIVTFLPAVVLAAEALWSGLPGRLAAFSVATLALWGLAETASIVRPETLLATAADRGAILWASTHTPRDAVFLIDVKPWMNVWRGADGGWWLMPLAGRRTLLPPLAYTWGPPDESDLIRATAARTYAVSKAPAEAYCTELDRLLTETDCAYYYTRSLRPLACPSLTVAYADPPVRILRSVEDR